MTTEDLQKVTQSMQVLDHFASTTNLDRSWHVRWQQVFQDVQQQIAALVDKPVDNSADKKRDKTAAKPKPSKPGAPSNN